MPEKLKPCPFCGSEIVYVVPASERTGMPHIYCDGCAAKGPREYSNKKAIAAWNKRVEEEVCGK